MVDDDIKQKLKREKNVNFVSEIIYNEKIYVKTIKMLEQGIEYIYYEIKNDEIKELIDKETLQYLRENYEINEGSIYY